MLDSSPFTVSAAAIFIIIAILYAAETIKGEIRNAMENIHQQFAEFRAAVDRETTRIADFVAKAIAKANTPDGLSPEELAETEATIQHLRLIGGSPEEPLPTPPATPVVDAQPLPAIDTAVGGGEAPIGAGETIADANPNNE